MDLELLMQVIIILLLVTLNVLMKKTPASNGKAIDTVLRLFEDRERKRKPGMSAEPTGNEPGPGGVPGTMAERIDAVDEQLKRMGL